ncbi:MAG: hypothetical protein IKY62_00265, partial [Clostridia bacterium]|nr:hypothetical protein [Clostridia bacterium]
MEDNNIKPSTKREKLENFWYYHKWHTIIAVFLIITITVCALQLSGKESYDIHIMYAGPKEFKRTSSDGDIPEYANALASIKRVASDFDGNGEDVIVIPDTEPEAPEKDTHIFSSVNIEKNSGIFYSSYTFNAVMNPQSNDGPDYDMNDAFKVTLTVE